EVGGSPGLLEQSALGDVEGDRLPGVVDDRSRRTTEARRQDVVVDEPVHPLRQSVEPGVGEGQDRLGGLELLAGGEGPGEALRVDAAGDAQQSGGAALDAGVVVAGVDE